MRAQRHAFPHPQPEYIPEPQEHAEQPVLTRILTSRVAILIVGLAVGGGAAWTMRPVDPARAAEPVRPVEVAKVVEPPRPPPVVQAEPPRVIEKTVERYVEKCAEPPKVVEPPKPPPPPAAPKPRPRPKPQPQPQPRPTAYDPFEGATDMVYAPVKRRTCIGIWCD
ncbi:MAG: hypothetical protein WAP03_20315 [Methylorubrum rhodinum]|uniref:hypothetical protein n=1 Tax=Methylorubrum rhodinum TaxID=29428 RepID=UPI003BAE7024